MNSDDEERFIYEQVMSAREQAEILRKQAAELQIRRNRADKILADAEQAALDYMTGNGVIESENFRIKKTQVIDVLGDYPDEYARIKREPDKRKIAAVKPEANWYVVKENIHLQLVGEK
jgi:hypothetical protein